MAWEEPWWLKIRRRVRKPYNKLFHDRHYFISRYRGADFLLGPKGIGTLEISAGISEHPELTNFMSRCAELRPDAFIDIGANIGLYTCILLKNRCVPKAILFEPDRQNLVQLKANLLINDLAGVVELHEIGLGDQLGEFRLVPGKIDGGFSRILESACADENSYIVQVARLDDVLSISGQKLAIKIDVEYFEMPCACWDAEYAQK